MTTFPTKWSGQMRDKVRVVPTNQELHVTLCLAAAVLKDLSASSYGGRAVSTHLPAAACLSFSVGGFFYRQLP